MKKLVIVLGLAVAFLLGMVMASMLTPPVQVAGSPATSVWSYGTSIQPITWTTSVTTTSLSASSTFSAPFCLIGVDGVFTASATNPVTVTLDDIRGSTYDVKLQVIDMGTATDFHWGPDMEICLDSGDQIGISWVNPSVTAAKVTVRVVETRR